jgi:hypothetical protein
MRNLLGTERTLLSRFLDFCLGTRLAPVRLPATDSHRHWDRVIRAWR